MSKRLFPRVSYQNALLGIMTMILVPLALLLASSLISLTEESNAADRDAAVVDFLLALDGVAHQLAVERGLSAGFLGSGKAEQRELLLKQRQNADQAIEQLKQVSQRNDLAALGAPSTLSLFSENFKQLSQVRSDVEQRNAPKAFSFYSKTNALSLNAYASWVQRINGDNTRLTLIRMYHASWTKERLGQIRGLVNGILSAGETNDIKATSLTDYIASLKASSGLLTAMARDTEIDERIQQIIQSRDYTVLVETGEKLAKESGAINIAEYPTPNDWFAQASAVINSIKSLNDENKSQQLIAAKQKISDARSSVIYQTIAAVIIGGLVAYMVFWIFTSIKRKVIKILKTLKAIVEHGDLSMRIDDQTTDELGSIARAIDRMVIDLSMLVGQLKNSIVLTDECTRQLTHTSDSLVASVNDIDTHIADIATSTLQMNANSEEIAAASNNTHQATQELVSESDTAGQLVSENQQATEHQLVISKDSMVASQELNDKNQQINMILESINQLADQTNLLALNAAIEAARAGESGRGFAVVADEVRQLANRSKQATADIGAVLNTLREQAESMHQLMERSNDASQQAVNNSQSLTSIIGQLRTSFVQINQLNSNIATSSDQQSKTTSEISQRANSVADKTKGVNSDVQNLKEMVQKLEQANGLMQSSVQSFKGIEDVSNTDLF